MKINNIYKKNWFVASVFVILFLVNIIIIPQEKTLGEGIILIYIHVALIFSGTVGFLISALLGVGVFFSANKHLQSWLFYLSLFSLILYFLGIGLSMIASAIFWGAINWTEPYMVVSLQIISITIIVLVAAGLIPNIRLKGFLNIIPFVSILLLMQDNKLILHPDSPIRNSGSLAIKFSFYSLLFIILTFTIWLVWIFRGKYSKPPNRLS
ncbi:hypothetical protein MNBD_IGNAVI01-1092 [hydrothermal vent metagenome]|uniref:Uncharacterized protein n=1 Tax=hydrothermal vent metagenome TaxID=652676 RepID=A0A3B1BR00_9ZZZZ